MEEREDNAIYKVVVNHEEQYSIWPAEKENPLGWKNEGKVGPKAECLAHDGYAHGGRHQRAPREEASRERGGKHLD